MSSIIRKLEPSALWQHFDELNAVPRASKKEEEVIQFMLDFAKDLNLPAQKDAVGNLLIRKAASTGMEGRKTVVLQSHLDMVHQKNNDTDFDFSRQGIQMYIQDDWVKAKGTTLGADNGIGVAAIMAILSSTDIAHPAIEALLTIDEETGMTGAKGLQAGMLTGDILLNLDTEEDTEIDIGCAGGIDITAKLDYQPEALEGSVSRYAITVKGLHGGHSGIEIHKGLGNANKILNRVLFHLSALGVRLIRIEGGGLRNAIPRESAAVIATQEVTFAQLNAHLEEILPDIKAEYANVDEGLEITLEKLPDESNVQVVPAVVHDKLIKSIYAAHNGVYRMSSDFADLVETSNNIARIQVSQGEILVKCLTRSSVESSKYDLANALKSCFELMGAQVRFSGDYPGWTPNANSAILDVLVGTYSELFGTSPEVVACHAGLECGILGTNYPQMDMISFGPTIRGAHSPQERVSISSVQKFWTYLKEILIRIPTK
ncbi:aminoacyl-histidine dipeptidase [Sphingobacterium sp. JB170]|uniref:aminoacyl-histidine dipeptidase n=1 Tax=Sphingobacterium sp. JB170 TaxID=1434842 RepID=UPI00097E8852|nr:aminoacyl-histidine dipeptidase [Sphingobacterium sp. JB170]SJN49654.1 Aminoacyl-histidine dipeptidase (Peptidase D) [Sphingobacterium sp. JB170]